MKKTVFILAHLLLILQANAQRAVKNLVYVDKSGVLRYTKDKTEAAFFGVNYTVPFAYGYRSHKALNMDPEKAIDADVHHMARLGLDAFRVHVWDVEISDSVGNLLENEHLRLFDYLIWRLKEANIKILVTPIAFWGNGYPEPDVKTVGFSSVYGKGPAVVKEEPINAQEAYLKQFFRHVNPYTKLTYRDDPDVIAMEINNEPHHSGPRERTTEYISRLAAAVRSTGWTKPIFYNISESPGYAGAVVKAPVDGHSFQWYPTGLVAGHELKGNVLPNVDQYRIPFGDSLPAFRNRAKMVYEFDAGDVMQPVMYPAMARSFRTAGFQWATQFAYDPLYTAYANTEYQTHYLNLAYTPAKAISLLIAGKAFHRLPRGKHYGTYPADSTFDVFRVSYRQQLSEMNSEEEFYYSGNTATQPRSPGQLQHIAGVGSSPVVQYEGTGTYFLDKLFNDVWRLEVMPDAISLRDPFEKASPQKPVTRIQWQANRMQVFLPGFAGNFTVTGLNEGNTAKQSVAGTSFLISPGVYLLAKQQGEFVDRAVSVVPFYAPPSPAAEPFVVHQPYEAVSPGEPFSLLATITGIDTSARVSIELRHSANKWKTLLLQRSSPYTYKAEVPAEMAIPGLINYRIMVQTKSGDTYTFPGGFKGDPYAWNEYRNESWQTTVAAPESGLVLFDPAKDRSRIMLYNPDWRNNSVEYVTAGKSSGLVWKGKMTQPAAGDMMGFQSYFTDKISGRRHELAQVSNITVRAKASEETIMTVSLITTDGLAYSAEVAVDTGWKMLEIPLRQLKQGKSLLLPRPYPGFQPLWFTPTVEMPFSLTGAERLEIRFAKNGALSSSLNVEVGEVQLWK